MKSPCYFYLWFLPLAFAFNSLISFKYPGDEYVTWAIASFPGIWAAILKDGDIQGLRFPVALGGMFVMALVGLTMDKTKVKKGIWSACFFIVPIGLWVAFWATSSSSNSLVRRSDSPSLIFGIVGLGLWLGSLISILITFIAKHWVRKTPAIEGAQN